jgi:hypothetical protein
MYTVFEIYKTRGSAGKHGEKEILIGRNLSSKKKTVPSLRKASYYLKKIKWERNSKNYFNLFVETSKFVSGHSMCKEVEKSTLRGR